MHVITKKSLELGEVIAENRKKLGWTQERLADFLGVTKASVSKWETAKTRPDILLLPDLATLFNVTIDDLLCYRSELSGKQIVVLYQHLLTVRTNDGLGDALELMEHYLRKHGNCVPFLLSLIQWLVNVGILGTTLEKTACFSRALELAAEIRRHSRNPSELDQLIAMEATIHMLMGEYDLVQEKGISVLKQERFALDELFLGALLAEGKLDELEEAGQALLFLHLNSVFAIIAIYFELAAQNEERFRLLVNLGSVIIETLNLVALPLNPILGFYLQATAGYCRIGELGQALRMLEKFVQMVEGLDFPLALLGNDFFDRLTPWLESGSPLSQMAPVDDATVRKKILDSVSLNSSFVVLRAYPEFEKIILRLKKKLEVD